MCMVTDYWTRVGGPSLYHDSYTYSLFSDRDVGPEVAAALAVALEGERGGGGEWGVGYWMLGGWGGSGIGGWGWDVGTNVNAGRSRPNP